MERCSAATERHGFMRSRAIAAALVVGITGAPVTARAHVGSGSGGAPIWETVRLVGVVMLAGLVLVPLTYDVVQGARARPPDRGWAIAQGVGGAGVTLFTA